MDHENFKPDNQRMILMSDAHLYESQDPLHKKLEGKNATGEKFIAKAQEKNEQKFILSLEEAQKIGKIDMLFFGGDMVTGYGERGITGPDSPQHIQQFKKTLDQYFLEMPKKYMAGGHELGYVLPLSTDPEGGPSEKSIELFEKNFNELFYTFDEGKYKFIVLSSDLEFLGKGSEALMKKQKLQQEFYKDEITYTEPEQKVVLMIHDPDALRLMYPFLKNNLGKIEKTFAGHQHAQWNNRLAYPAMCQIASSRMVSAALRPIINKLFPGKAEPVLDYFRENKDNAKIWQSVKLSVIPAPSGMMGVGGGFLVANLNDQGIEVKKVKI